MTTPGARVGRQAVLRGIYRDYMADPAFAHMRRGQRLVPGRGSMFPTLVMVGEAPGEMESISRKPFKGPAGGVLDRLLHDVGLTRSELFITNMVKYRPVIGQIKVRNRTPTPREIDASRSYVFRELAVFENTHVITFGNTPLRGLFRPDVSDHRSKIGEWHGHGWYDADRMYFAMYHPAVAVYDPGMYATLLADFTRAVTEFAVGSAMRKGDGDG